MNSRLRTLEELEPQVQRNLQCSYADAPVRQPLKIAPEFPSHKQPQFLTGRPERDAASATCHPSQNSHLLAQLLDRREREREAIACALHDDVGQRLSVIEMLLSDLDQSQIERQTALNSHMLRAHVQAVSESVRLLAHRTYPTVLRDLGLPAALRSLADRFVHDVTREIHVSCRNIQDKDFKRSGLALYRIAEEALTNVTRHAGETSVSINLRQIETKLELSVIDKGKGFDSSVQHGRHCIGLKSMQEHARMLGGDVLIRTSPGKGTVVTATVPSE